MSYARPLETGHYIWSDGKEIEFDGIKVPEKAINVFLYGLYVNRRKEFRHRLALGKREVDNHKLSMEE